MYIYYCLSFYNYYILCFQCKLRNGGNSAEIHFVVTDFEYFNEYIFIAVLFNTLTYKGPLEIRPISSKYLPLNARVSGYLDLKFHNWSPLCIFSIDFADF